MNCLGPRGREGKSGVRHLTISALQVRRRTTTAVKIGVCTVNPAVACDVLESLSAFAFYDPDNLPLVLDCSWSPCVYLYQVQYDLQKLLYLYLITSWVNSSTDDNWKTILIVLFHYVGLVKLLSPECCWSVSALTNFKLTELNTPGAQLASHIFPHCYHIYLHCLVNSSFWTSCSFHRVCEAQQVESMTHWRKSDIALLK